MTEYDVILEKDEEGWYIATVPAIQGCYTQGRTLSEVIERIKEAIEVCIVADGLEKKFLKFVGIQRVEIEDGKAS